MATTMIVLQLLLWFCVEVASCESFDAWQDRVIYQLLTDRFAKYPSSYAPCSDLNDYCGGSFAGMESNLDYIAGMGFDAIWISPIPEQNFGRLPRLLDA